MAKQSLSILDLAYNNLSGTIPECFSNFDFMAGKGNLPYPFEFFPDMSILKTPKIGESTSLVTKSIELEYSTNVYLMMIIDLASNSLSRPIPDAITNLVGLKSLNLSRNSLTGRIPHNMGNMSPLESLDLSLNRLSGDIHPSMAAMTSLSFLNLSYNNLSGRIPVSTQFSTFNEYRFTGNDLCGPPLSNNCSSDVTADDGNEGKNRNHHGVGFNEFYVSMAMGFAEGFWAVVGPLLYSESWEIQVFPCTACHADQTVGVGCGVCWC